MICAEFLTLPDGRLLGFRIEGHSGYAEEGADIVCAAVSSATYMTANTVTEVLGISPVSLRAEDGDMLLRVEPRDEPNCRDLFAGLKVHLKNMEEQYPDFVTVKYLEV